MRRLRNDLPKDFINTLQLMDYVHALFWEIALINAFQVQEKQ